MTTSCGNDPLMEGGALVMYELKPTHQGMTNEELLDELRKVAQALGKKTVRYKDYERHGRCKTQSFHLRFGSWNKALRAAGLEVCPARRIPNSALFENLGRVWRTLGRAPRKNEMVKPLSAVSVRPYETRFGGWRRALVAFVAFANGSEEPVVAVPAAARVLRRGPRHPTPRLRYEVLKRDSFKCQACGKSPATDSGVELEVDHKIPWSQGGPTTLENLTTLCTRCNQGKGDCTEMPNGA